MAEEAENLKVVVGVDGSPGAEEALRQVVELARARRTRDVEVIAAFVRHTPWLAYEGDMAGGAVTAEMATSLDRIAETSRRLSERVLEESGTKGRFEVRRGDPAHELMELATAEGALCVVVGARRHSPVASVVLGSVASRLVHYCPVSVFIVRSPQDRSVPAPQL